MGKKAQPPAVGTYIYVGVVTLGFCAIVWGIGGWLGALHAQEAAGDLEPTAFPDVFVDHRTVDLGFIPPDHTAEAKFTLHNSGRDSYTVTKVTTSCGCATVNLANTSIPPAGSLVIPVRVNTSSLLTQSGFEKAVLVELNHIRGDPNLKDVFKFKGRIDRSGTFVVWPSAIDCSDTVPGRQISGTVYFKADLRLLEQLPSEIESLSPTQEIRLVPVDYAGRLGVKRIRIVSTIPANAAEGLFTSCLVVKTPGQTAQTVQITLRSRITNGIAVTPEKVFLSVVRGKTPVQALITIRSIDERPLAIDRISASFPLDWSLPSGPQEARTLVIVLSYKEPQSGDRSLCSTVTIHLRDGRTANFGLVIVPADCPDRRSEAGRTSYGREPAT
jgi:hypothetical protein